MSRSNYFPFIQLNVYFIIIQNPSILCTFNRIQGKTFYAYVQLNIATVEELYLCNIMIICSLISL